METQELYRFLAVEYFFQVDLEREADTNADAESRIAAGRSGLWPRSRVLGSALPLPYLVNPEAGERKNEGASRQGRNLRSPVMLHLCILQREKTE